ncbi:hypothetical protein JIG36_46320 [Actinoplanes sp. LDG1-06]|uniref:Uncharacterized protein n=1 Tax=Paractinoplanes ovalisporus TaxID=2810368 RepID=A0ABS2ASW0_9ACTN|nr:hypothetical protein [Actinoplanes ovalisporus]MBM2622940.1 hypothetical protein [Actinoplanes ovalisporus]
MSPGGTDASLLELVVGFFVAVSLIAVITMILRRRSGREDLLGTQVREMEARASAAAGPGADTRQRDAATRIAGARIDEAASRAPVPAQGATDEPAPGAALDAGFLDATAGERSAQDATAPPDGWPLAADGKNDAMADAFAWLRIAAMVDAGQREQAVELLSATMDITTDEAQMLVDGLNDAGSERRPD